MKNPYTRRGLLANAAAMAFMSLLEKPTSASEDLAPKFSNYPFTLGIASGDPTSGGFVLWTRIAPHPFDPDALSAGRFPVTWEVATDQSFKNLIQSGVSYAYKKNAYAVHTTVYGLKPNYQYFYRFHVGGETSPTGRAKTLPIIGAKTEKFRFATACCQSITDGHFAAYRDIASMDLDLLLHTGDYIYEQDWVGGDRRLPIEEALDLKGYRELYAAYKIDPLLQAAHASSCWMTIWDDHELENDWGGDYSPDYRDLANGAEAFVRRKAAAFKAYFEHMPLGLEARPARNKLRLNRRAIVGDLVQFDLLDCRQYRSPPACENEPRTFRGFTELCSEALSAERSMLGADQQVWLDRGLGHFPVKWNALVQTTQFAPFDFLKGPTTAFDMDVWDGFSANRQQIIDTMVQRNIENAVSLGGNIHAFYSGLVHQNPFDATTKPIMTEIVSTSLSSGGGGDARYENTISQFGENLSANFFENRKRGYVLSEVTPKEWTSQLRTVNNPYDPASDCETLRTVTIESGKVAAHIS